MTMQKSMTVGLVAAVALGVALSATGEEKPFDTITCPLILGETTEPTDAHADEIIAAVRANVEKLRAADPQAVPMAFWDCDGTILNGDISLGLYDRSPEHRKLYRGLLEEAIVAGYSKILRGEEGWQEFRDVHHPFFAKLGRWIAGPYNAQLFAGAKVAELDAFCERKTKGEISDWFFALSIKMLRALEEMGVENYVVSAGPAPLVRNVMPALGLSRDRFVGTAVREVCGRWTDEAIRPAPDGEGKVESVRQIILSRPNGVAVAGFGNSYKTDGPFLKYIRSQRLPGGGEGVSVMINGGKPGAYAGLFRCVNQRICLRDCRYPMQEGRKLVWSEEFDGTNGLDHAKWRFRRTMNRKDAVYANDSRTARIEDGCLHLQVLNSGDKEKPWMLSEGVTTHETMGFRYGYLEMRANVPFRAGAWPSFWMQSTPKLRKASWMSEMDIFEVFSSSNSLASALHKWGGGKHVSAQGRKDRPKENGHFTFANAESLNDETHIYGFEWTPQSIRAYVDGKCYFDYPITPDADFGTNVIAGVEGFHDYHSIIFNNEIFTKGANWCPPAYELKPDAKMPIDYRIDWVRLWQKPGEDLQVLK